MTTITLYIDEDGDERGFRVSGHSFFRRKGKDIVCAAISTMTIFAINAIEVLTDDKPTVNKDDSDAMISCIFDQKPSEQAKKILYLFRIQAGDIVESYGKNARIITETRR